MLVASNDSRAGLLSVVLGVMSQTMPEGLPKEFRSTVAEAFTAANSVSEEEGLCILAA